MAIHVRIRPSSLEIIRAHRRKMLVISVSISMGVVLLLGLLLAWFKYYIMNEDSASFVSLPYEQMEEHVPEAPITKKLTTSGGSAVSVSPELALDVAAESLVMTDFIVADTDDLSSMVNSGMGLDALGGLGSGLAGLGDGLGDATGSGRSSLPGGSKGSNDDIQIVLMLDASGSMTSLFHAVAKSMDDIIAILRASTVNGQPAKVKLGIVVYGQAKDNGAPWELHKFTTSADRVKNLLMEVRCDGAEEPVGDAIAFALKNFPWNMRQDRDPLKIIFVAGNEELNQGTTPMDRALAQAREYGVIINTIHCGSENEEWMEAAQRGGGQGVAFDYRGGDSEALTPDEVLELLTQWYEVPVVPTGSAAEQAAALQQFKDRPKLPKSEKQVSDWVMKNRRAMLAGYSWDAVEIFRSMEGKFSLASVGGRGNLPPELAAKPDDEIISHLEDLAARKATIREEIMKDSSGFTTTIMSVMIDQAAAKGIVITP